VGDGGLLAGTKEHLQDWLGKQTGGWLGPAGQEGAADWMRQVAQQQWQMAQPYYKSNLALQLQQSQAAQQMLPDFLKNLMSRYQGAGAQVYSVPGLRKESRQGSDGAGGLYGYDQERSSYEQARLDIERAQRQAQSGMEQSLAQRFGSAEAATSLLPAATSELVSRFGEINLQARQAASQQAQQTQDQRFAQIQQFLSGMMSGNPAAFGAAQWGPQTMMGGASIYGDLAAQEAAKWQAILQALGAAANAAGQAGAFA